MESCEMRQHFGQEDVGVGIGSSSQMHPEIGTDPQNHEADSDSFLWGLSAKKAPTVQIRPMPIPIELIER